MMRNDFFEEKPGGSPIKKSFQHVKERRILNPTIRGQWITNPLERELLLPATPS